MPPAPTDFDVRVVGDAERRRVRRLVEERWGADYVVAHGVIYHPHRLAGFVALDPAGRFVGLVTYLIEGRQCEIVTLDSLAEGRGVGTALVGAVLMAATRAGCVRVWLITTNDNLRALGFYQRRGFELVAIHRGALQHSRRLKPSIPTVSPDGIPLRDELELEYHLAGPR